MSRKYAISLFSLILGLSLTGEAQAIKIYSTISQEIAPSSSVTVNITVANKGYWAFRTNQKVFIDFRGGEADADDFYLEPGEILDLYPISLKAGEIIKMNAATATANITGFSYE